MGEVLLAVISHSQGCPGFPQAFPDPYAKEAPNPSISQAPHHSAPLFLVFLKLNLLEERLNFMGWLSHPGK